jgi:LEA14-like dessication related protein
MIYRPFIWLLLVILSVTGCKMVEPFFTKPIVSYENVALQDMSLFDATLLFTFAVDNPNAIGVVLQKGTYDFTIENYSMVSGTVDEQIRVKAGGSESINVPVHVNFMDFFNSISAFAHRDEVAYVLSGSFDIMGFTIPYKTGGKLALPEFPEISLETINISDISLSKAKINVLLAVTNPNNFAIGLDQLQYSLNVGGFDFLAGATETIRGIDKNERVTISVPLEMDFISMGRSAMHLLEGNPMTYKLSGDMRFSMPVGGTKDLPFSRVGEVSLNR